MYGGDHYRDPIGDIDVDHELNEGELSEFLQSRRLLKLVLLEIGLVFVIVFTLLSNGASPLGLAIVGLSVLLGIGAALAVHLRTRKEERAFATWLPRTVDGDNRISPRLLAQGALTFVLWGCTAVLGLWVIEIFIVKIWPAIFLTLAGQMTPEEQQKVQLLSSYCWLLPLGLAWLLLVLIGAEYHRKRVGRSSSWKVFALTLGVEGALLLVMMLA